MTTGSSASTSSTTSRSCRASRSWTTPAARRSTSPRSTRSSRKRTAIRLDSFVDPEPDPAGRGRRPGALSEKGPPVRRGHARDQGDAGRPEAGAPHLPHRTRGQRSASATSSSWATRRSATGPLRQMKANKEPVDLLLHHRARHVPGNQVRGRRGPRRRVLPRTTATSRRASASPSSSTLQGFLGREDPARPAADPRSGGRAVPRGPVQLRRQQGRQGRALRPMFRLSEGEFYDEKKIRKGLQ